MPPGMHAAAHPPLQRLQRADPAARPRRARRCREQQLFDYGINFIRTQLATVQGAQRAAARTAASSGRSWSTSTRSALYAHGLSPRDVSDAINAQNLDPARRHAPRSATREYPVRAQQQPGRRRARSTTCPIKTVERHDGLHARRRPGARRLRACRRTSCARDGRRGALLTILKNGNASTLDIVEQVQGAAAAHPGDAAAGARRSSCCSTSRCSCARRSTAWCTRA